ncbi:MAG: hypothetical protein ACI9FB_002461 [Candidatus Azotimanducaceae bacterium]|jgi:hypothetical protein
MRLRQVALVAKELKQTRVQLFTILGLENDFRDPGVAEFGLDNSVMSIGDTFLEVVSPITEDTTAGRLLSRRQGDGGYMVLVQVPDLDFFEKRTHDLKIRKIWEVELSDTRAFHLHPKDMGGAIVSIDEMQPPESWRWGGPDWENRRAHHVTGISAVDIQAKAPKTMATQWAKVFNEEARLTDSGWQIALDDGKINFVEALDDRGDGVCAIEFRCNELSRIEAAAKKMGLHWQENELNVCGTRLRFVIS